MRINFSFLKKFHRILFSGLLLQLTWGGCAEVAAQDFFKGSLINKHEGAQTIRSIRVEIRDIFEQGSDIAGEGAAEWLYKTANDLKISTKESSVRRELLFKEGDGFDQFLLAESERALRRLPYLRQIKITPYFDGAAVDILVQAQDTWTLFPFISFSFGTGTNKTSIGVAESNLLGRGKRLEVLYADDDGREKVEAAYDDKRLFGTHQHLAVGAYDRSDGYRTVAYYGQPFRSLVDKYSWSFNTDVFDLVGKLYKAGTESFIYREQYQAGSVGLTKAYGNPEEQVRRFTFGYDYLNADFVEATDKDFDQANVDLEGVSRDPALLADDQRFSGPTLGLQFIEPDFMTLGYLDRFDRKEDYNLGNESLVRLTYAADVLGSFEDTLLFNLSQASGWRFGDTAFLRAKVGLSSRATTEAVENTLLTADLRYYNVLGDWWWDKTYLGKHTFITSLSVDFGDRLDRDRQLLLGAGTGMRAYSAEAFAGEQSIVLNIEERAHLIDDLYRLFNVGTAVFVDVGGVSDQGLGDIITDELRVDVGVGLRIGFPRSSGGSTVRIDLAFPLRNGPDDDNQFSPRLVVTTGETAVNARLPNESQQSPGQNVTVKFVQ